MALGASLTALGVLMGVWLVNTSTDRQTVVVVRHDVPYGSVITSADLTTTQISTGSGIDAISGSHMDQLVGQVAATNLTAGSLLTSAEIAAAAPPASGEVLVALAIPASRMPAGPLESGDRVLVVATPPAGADLPALPPSTIPATIVRVGAPDANGVTVVDVTAAPNVGPALAALSATGRLALVLQPRNG